jgi:hypothetical protein
MDLVVLVGLVFLHPVDLEVLEVLYYQLVLVDQLHLVDLVVLELLYCLADLVALVYQLDPVDLADQLHY